MVLIVVIVVFLACWGTSQRWPMPRTWATIADRYVINIALPAVIIAKVSQVELTQESAVPVVAAWACMASCAVLVFLIGLGARERIRSVTGEFRRGEAIKVVEQHVITFVVHRLGIAVDELTRAVTGAGIVGLAIAPIKEAPIVVGHDALVGLADKRLGALGGEQTAGPFRIGVVGQNPADQGQCVVEAELRLGRIRGPQRAGRDPKIPERAVLDGCGRPLRVAINHRIARDDDLRPVGHRGATRESDKPHDSQGGREATAEKLNSKEHRTESG